jgi:thiol-disulfide isomerase/thioredoxin
MKRQTSFGAATLLALAVCVLGACTGGTDSLRPLTDGDPAPAWGGVTLSGDSVGAHVGDTPLLVNVWATWCVPCREEMPALQQLHEETEGRLRIVAVSIDGSGAGADIAVGNAGSAGKGLTTPSCGDTTCKCQNASNGA